jgi:ABC-type nickel/cobalt efflux system permease component RcnA
MTRVVLAIVFFCLASLPIAFSANAQNPFLSKGDKEKTVQKKIKAPEVLHPILDLVAKWQKQLKTKLTAFARDIHANPYGKSFWLFLLLSFAYGVVHAVGPGHGKTISCAYFLSRPAHLIQGFLMGNLVAFMHVFSAVVIVVTVYFILKRAGMTTFDTTSVTLQKLSYLILLLLGVVLAFKSILGLKTHRDHVRTGGAQPADLKSLIAVSLATGLIPCPGAAIILSFSVILNIVVAGLIAMFCIAVGMGVTTTAFDLVTITSRRTVLRFFDHNSRGFFIFHGMISLTGSLGIILISSLLLLSRV